MIDTVKQTPLRVSVGGEGSSYLMVPLMQLDQVRELLDRHEIRYWVGENVISLDKGPEIAFVQFGRSGDPSKIQAILDGAQ